MVEKYTWNFKLSVVKKVHGWNGLSELQEIIRAIRAQHLTIISFMYFTPPNPITCEHFTQNFATDIFGLFLSEQIYYLHCLPLRPPEL